jgi:hypothetical protein
MQGVIQLRQYMRVYSPQGDVNYSACEARVGETNTRLFILLKCRVSTVCVTPIHRIFAHRQAHTETTRPHITQGTTTSH